jgi:hypothetical protein
VSSKKERERKREREIEKKLGIKRASFSLYAESKMWISTK